MSKRQELAKHLGTLHELSEIMGAMKNLALMESHKLTRFLSTQRRVVATIESAATDFFTFYPELMVHPSEAESVYLVIGSERGFCGDFNEALLDAAWTQVRERHVHTPLLITVGHKLAAKVVGDERVIASIEGPNVVEEAQPVLIHLMDTLNGLHARSESFSPLTLTVLFNRADETGIHLQAFQPFRQFGRGAGRFSHPPLLNMPPRSFLASLIDQYLFAVLHEVFYSSLMAENRRRFQHMDNAIQRMEREASDLARRRNVLRQEEITEEIEVIMLSAEALRRQS
ncbi:MAG: F0F1 ATP synthase subunit gamma [Nitrospirota bacterium]|nr:F0F1 ATP synthase subunit gamma [Nitrospirota bacterium]